MIYHNSKEILSEIRRIMFLNNITIKDLALRMNKSQQSISQIFSTANPQLETLLLVCNALCLELDISFIDSNE